MGHEAYIGFVCGALASLGLFFLGSIYELLKTLRGKPIEQLMEKKPSTLIRSKGYSVSSKLKPIIRDDFKAMETEAGWASKD